MSSVAQTNPPKSKFHPFLTIFPEMERTQFAEFVADIKANGVREPIWIYKGLILDGRNRWLACESLGIKCPTREYTGDEKGLLPFVVSQNLHRRHLTESQRAMIGGRIANMTHGGDRKSDQAAALPLVSQAEAGKQVGVSERSIRDAVRVLSKAEPEIVKAADNGRLPVSAAAKVAEHPPEVQRQAVASIDQGAKPAAVVRALPTSSGKAKPNAPAPAKLSREQKTPHEKATDVWVEMISLEARWREWREWQDEHDGEALWSFAPSEFWPLLNYDRQEEMVRIAKVLVPWLTAIIEQAAPQKKTAASSTIVAKPKLVKSKGERVM